jgi:acyl-CoA synthetase (NDP forming)
MVNTNRLNTLINPRAIAIVGASDRPSSWTKVIYSNLKAFGYPGQIYPINPGRSTVWDQPAFPSLNDMSVDIDLAIIAIPAAAAVEAVEACGEANIPAAMVVSSGFRDAGPEGAQLQKKLTAAAEAGDVVVLGPNVEGFINYTGRVAAYGAEMPPAPSTGSISMFSQSGTAAWTFAQMAGDRGVGTRLITGVGVEATFGVGELLEWAAADSETTVVACYIEAIRNFEVLSNGFEALAAAGKRVVVCCPRVSGEAAQASVVAHTGELLGDTTLRDAALRRLGAAVVYDPIALFETALLLECAPPDCSGNVAVAMQSGGNCTLFADALDNAEVSIEKFRSETTDKLAEVLPAYTAPRNPLDVTGQAIFEPEIYCGAMQTLADDSDIGLIVIDVAPSRHNPADEDCIETDCREILRGAGEIQRSSGKPVISVLATPLSYPGRTAELLSEQSIAVLQGHASAATAIAELFRCSLPKLPIAQRNVTQPRVAVAPGVLDEVQAAEIFSAYGIERPLEAVADTPERVAELADKFSNRVVVKLVCAEIPHKAIEGLVKLGLDTPSEAKLAAKKIQDRARELGVDANRMLVQEQLDAGPEYLIGITFDPLYGPAMTVRPGGGDVAGKSRFHLLPLRQGEAAELAAKAAANTSPSLSKTGMEALTGAVERLSWLAVDLSEQLLEIEANPIIITGGRAIAVDALAVAHDESGEK